MNPVDVQARIAWLIARADEAFDREDILAAAALFQAAMVAELALSVHRLLTGAILTASGAPSDSAARNSTVREPSLDACRP